MPTGERIRIEKKKALGLIVMDRPESLNVFDTISLRELRDILMDISDDTEVRAVIITGAKHFSAGADIRELKEKDTEKARVFARLGQGICDWIENMKKPVIAAVEGFALGAGCEIALACDMRIASENAKFGQPEVGLGLVPGFGGTQRLTRLVGIGKAKEMILTGRTIDAGEAETMGLVNRVVASEQLLDSAEEIAAEIARKSPVALKLAKMLINGNHEIGEGLKKEMVFFSECFGTEDRREGINAFLEKRVPEFKGA
jgi:enoyl-CoA hydratase